MHHPTSPSHSSLVSVSTSTLPIELSSGDLEIQNSFRQGFYALATTTETVTMAAAVISQPVAPHTHTHTHTHTHKATYEQEDSDIDAEGEDELQASNIKAVSKNAAIRSEDGSDEDIAVESEEEEDENFQEDDDDEEEETPLQKASLRRRVGKRNLAEVGDDDFEGEVDGANDDVEAGSNTSEEDASGGGEDWEGGSDAGEEDASVEVANRNNCV